MLELIKNNIIIVVGYLLILNTVGLCAFGIDKQKAIKNKWRIPEATLIGIAFLGGSLGALAGMKIFHHKTKKPKFYVGIPAIIIFQIILLILGVLLIS